MLKGCYYRCPIPIEQGDAEHPRIFILAQLLEYNELADAAKVKMHDLLGTFQYYNEVFRYDVFHAPTLTRCEAIPGGVVEGDWGRGTIISRIESCPDDQPYYYNIKLSSGHFIKACETDIKIEYS